MKEKYEQNKLYNYKGNHFGNSFHKRSIDPITGAHFLYSDIFIRLNKLITENSMVLVDKPKKSNHHFIYNFYKLSRKKFKDINGKQYFKGIRKSNKNSNEILFNKLKDKNSKENCNFVNESDYQSNFSKFKYNSNILRNSKLLLCISNSNKLSNNKKEYK